MPGGLLSSAGGFAVMAVARGAAARSRRASATNVAKAAPSGKADRGTTSQPDPLTTKKA
jgi:hypothetical protein